MDQMDLVGMAEGDILRAQIAGVTEPAIAYETPQTFDVDRGRGAGFLVTRIRHYKFVLFARRRLALSSSIRLYRPTRDAGKDWRAYAIGDAPARGATFVKKGRVGLSPGPVPRFGHRSRPSAQKESLESFSRGS